MAFKEQGLLPELLRSLKAKNYSNPTPVQSEFIPAALSGRDVWVTAPTGSGKTLAFALPLINQFLQRQDQISNQPQSNKANGYRRSRPVEALVLVPTRELAIQVGQTLMSLTAQWGLLCKTTVVFGGVSINPQMMGLRGGTNILIATPGRLIDLLDHNALKLSHVQTLVLDEADKLLEMGFQDELHCILNLLPARRQNLFLSATKPKSIEILAQRLLQNPIEVEIANESDNSSIIEQRVIYTERTKRTQLLKHLINEKKIIQALVFVATQHSCEVVAAKLRVDGISAEPFHAKLNQGKRQQVLADFKASRVKVVLATDLAARGLDIEKLPVVINFDLPRSAVDYTHRIGRTGRAGESGLAISFICPESLQHWGLIEKRHAFKLPLETIPGFEPKAKTPLPLLSNGGIKGRRPSKKDKLRQMASSKTI
jgi:ATP-dependent RNA helicase RhlE